MVRIHFRAAVCAIALAAAAGLATSANAQESVMKQCGDKWQAAKAANQVPAGVTWPKFLSQCRADLSSQQPAPAPAAPTTTALPKPAPAPMAPKPAPTQTTTTMPTTSPATGGTVGQQSRIKQCGAEWRANKATLQPQFGSWPKYWSACDKRMKAAGQ